MNKSLPKRSSFQLGSFKALDKTYYARNNGWYPDQNTAFVFGSKQSFILFLGHLPQQIRYSVIETRKERWKWDRPVYLMMTTHKALWRFQPGDGKKIKGRIFKKAHDKDAEWVELDTKEVKKIVGWLVKENQLFGAAIVQAFAGTLEACYRNGGCLAEEQMEEPK